MNVRKVFADRLEVLLTHFAAHLLGWEGVAVQLMNDFPQWLPDELRLVARRTDIVAAKLEAFYLKSYRLFREKRLDEQKPFRGHAQVLGGAIREIEGQAYEPPKKPKDPWSNSFNQQPGPSVEELADMINKMQGDQQSEFERIFRGNYGGAGKAKNPFDGATFNSRPPPPGPDPSTSMDELMRRAKAAGARTSFDTKKPWASAPGYLHMHLEILELKWPSTRDEAKKQYRVMAMKTHPDRNGGQDATFKKVQMAWERVEEYFEKNTT